MATQTAAAPAPAPAPAVNNAAPAANNAAPAANVDGAQIHRNTALYVGDLAPTVNEADLFEMFNAVASVASVRVCRHAISRKSLGECLIRRCCACARARRACPATTPTTLRPVKKLEFSVLIDLSFQKHRCEAKLATEALLNPNPSRVPCPFPCPPLTCFRVADP